MPTDGAESNIWTIVIEPTGNGFEKYAPNGMAWKYELKEKVSEKTGRLQINNNDDDPANRVYTPSTPNGKSDGIWENSITDTSTPIAGSDPETYTLGKLTNSTLTQANFAKEWQDKSENPITKDYLGFDLTVNFQLQVRTGGEEGVWENALINQYGKEDV